MAVSLILRYTMKWSRFMTVRATLSLIVTRGDSEGKALLMAYSARVDTWAARSIITSRSLRSQTTLETAHSFSNLAWWRLWSSAKISGFFLTLDTRRATTLALTLYARATSLWVSKETWIFSKISIFSYKRSGPRFFDLFLFPGATSASKSGTAMRSSLVLSL